MNEKLVTSLSISQQMKEAGIEQKLDEGDWAYCSCCNKLHLFANDDDDNIYCIDHKIENVEEWHKAFTAGELGEMLPKRKLINDRECSLRIWTNDTGEYWYCGYGRNGIMEINGSHGKDKTLVESMAKMLIHLIQNGFINISDIKI